MILVTTAGDSDWITDDVARLLGRPARTFRQFAADHAFAFAHPPVKHEHRAPDGPTAGAGATSAR